MSFAFKIDKALRANLYKICRLCGIDRDETVPILGTTDDPIGDGELLLHEKIKELIGILVSKDDKMPQTVCSLCVEKINDFYEFREMCYATNLQTRKLLGLRGDGLKKAPAAELKLPVEVKEEPTFLKRMRKRKADDLLQKPELNEFKREVGVPLPTNKKQRLAARQAERALKPKEEIKEEPLDYPATITTNSNSIGKNRPLCNICDQRFVSKLKLDAHQAKTHIPNIPRYVCIACDETIKKALDIKNHQLWHKLSKTSYVCGLCAKALTSSYAYSRHLRDHCVEVPPALLVLDRVCPQCQQTFVTNFLYNIHPCAVRTKKCAGCNRALRNELEYQRHIAGCTKAYRKHSTHIPAAALAAESCVRIKNENDVEAAAAAEFLARNAGVSLDMAPVVSLTRMSTPVLMAANHCVAQLADTEIDGESDLHFTDAKTSKKSGKKGVSKKDLKRVDELLKSTLDALVSIKHEPEVQVDTETDAGRTHNAATGTDSGDHYAADDFHHADDDDDDDEDGGGINVTTSVTVKRETVDESYNEHHVNPSINIKQEVMDTTDVIDVDAESTLGTKMPVLKLKIKKEHGTLNSSIIDDEGQRSEKKKKKKKRKEAEKGKEKEDKNPTSVEANHTANTNDIEGAEVPTMPRIKQEPLENELPENPQIQGEATVMTSIPRMQFQIACISSGVEFTAPNDADEEASTTAESAGLPNMSTCDDEMPDVKPNREELERMLMITNVVSGVPMAAEQDSTGKSLSNNPRSSNIRPSPSKAANRTPKRSSSGKAVKSTGGVARNENTGVGVDVMDMANIRIKPEPIDRGYDDVYSSQYGRSDPDQSVPEQPNELTINEASEEQEYLKSIDFANVKIKQEKDEISEIEMCNNELTVAAVPNGVDAFNSGRRESQMSTGGSASDSGSGEEDEEESEINEEEEVREYREIDMPPLLSAQDLPVNVAELNGNGTEADANAKQDVEFYSGNTNAAILTQASTCFKISAVSAGCVDFDKPNEDVAYPATEAETLRLEVREESEVTLKAQPFTDNNTSGENNADNSDISAETDLQDSGDHNEDNVNDSDVEEQQNVLNHEVAAQATQQTQLNCAALPSESNAECLPACGANNDEETENLINESAAEAQRLQQQQQQHQASSRSSSSTGNANSDARIGSGGGSMVINHFLIDDSNINEIAENNNNANIERELEDVVAAAERARSAECLEQRSNDIT